MHQWIAPDKTPFLRFLFAMSLSKYARPSLMTAISTAAVGQRRRNFTGVKSSFAAGGGNIRCYQSGQRYPLEMIGDFNCLLQRVSSKRLRDRIRRLEVNVVSDPMSETAKKVIVGMSGVSIPPFLPGCCNNRDIRSKAVYEELGRRRR